MKNLLILTAMGIGDRYAMGAPTFWKTMNGFAADGWNIWILNASVRGGEKRYVDYGDGVHLIEEASPWQKLAEIRKLGVFFWRLQCRWIRRWHLRQAEELIRNNGWTGEDTVLYADDILAVHGGKQLSTTTGMKLVTRFCGIWDTYLLGRDWKTRMRVYPRYEAYETPADLIIATNDGTRGDRVFRSFHNESPLCFWRNGVDRPREKQTVPSFTSELSDGDRVMMTLCRLQKDKHVDRAIEALAEVRKTHPEVKLVAGGYGPENDRLHRLAEQLGVADAVIFTGAYPHAEVYDYLRYADVFLSCFDVSNLGNPTFEALRAGVPVVTIDVGDTDTVVIHEENGLLVSPEHFREEFPQAVCRLLEDHDLRKRLGEGALRFSDEHFWTWDERVAAEVEAVNGLLTKKRERE